MKRRLLLSCVSCLLALGLVTACNNDDEVDLNEDDGTTQNDGGGSDGTTQGGGTTSTTLSNYTLSFAFVDEAGEALEIPSWGLISIQGSWDGWKGWISLTPEEDGTYTYTFDSIATGSYEYTGVLWYADEDPVWTIQVVVGETATNRTLTVDGTEGDDYLAPTVTLTITEEQLALLPEERTPAVYLSNYTIQLGLVDGSGEAVTICSDLTFYVEGSFNDWTLVAPEYSSETGLYTIEVEEIEVGWHQFLGISMPVSADEPIWDGDDANVTKVVQSGSGDNAYFEVLESEGDDATRTIYWDTINNVEYIKGAGLDVSVYFAVIDTTTATEITGINSLYFEHEVEQQYEGIFPENGDNEYWYGWCNATLSTVIDGTDTHVVAYNATVGAMKTGEEVWMTIHADYKSQDYYFDCVVPLDVTGEVSAYTFVAYADLTVLESWVSDNPTVAVSEDISETVTCYEGEATTVLASLATTAENPD